MLIHNHKLDYPTIKVPLTDITRVLQVSHDDLDGVGATVVTQSFFNALHPDHANRPYIATYRVTNSEVDAFVWRLIAPLADTETDGHTLILITDVSVSDDSIVNTLTSINNTRDDVSVVLLDHHPTARRLNIHDWAIVESKDGHIRTSGTSMWTSLLSNHMTSEEHAKVGEEFFVNLKRFGEYVRRYDTWDWTRDVLTSYDRMCSQRAEDLNTLLYEVGRDKFLNRFVENIKPVLNHIEEGIIKPVYEKRDAYLREKIESAKLLNFNGLEVAAVEATEHVSMLGNRLHQEYAHRGVKAGLVINREKRGISLRSVDEDIDLGHFVVQQFGRANAGGHGQTAGATPQQFTYLLDNYRKRDKITII